MKKSNTTHTKHISKKALSSLAAIATLTAKIGAGTASSWGNYQPTLPKSLKR